MTAAAIPAPAESEEGLSSSIRAVMTGDPSSFVVLYDRYSRGVYNLVLRSVRDPQLAEDICQEVWLKVHRNVADLRDEAAFASWLYCIAARTCVSAARARAAEPRGVELNETVSDASLGPEATCLEKEELGLAWEALGSLASRHQIALYLREVEGRSYEQIATALDTSHSAVETLLFRARSSFARSHLRLESSSMERCREAARVMAALVDEEATEVQKRALAAHVDTCASCRRSLSEMRAAAAAYAAIPLAHLPALLTTTAFESLAAVTAGEIVTKGGGLAALLAKAKGLAIFLAVSGGLTAGSISVQHLDFGSAPASSLRPAAAAPAATPPGVSGNQRPQDASRATVEPVPVSVQELHSSLPGVADRELADGGPPAIDAPTRAFAWLPSDQAEASRAQDPAAQLVSPDTSGVAVDPGGALADVNLTIGGEAISGSGTAQVDGSLPVTTATAGLTTSVNTDVKVAAAANAGVAVKPGALSVGGASLSGSGGVSVAAAPTTVQAAVPVSTSLKLTPVAPTVSVTQSLPLPTSTPAPAVATVTSALPLLGH